MKRTSKRKLSLFIVLVLCMQILMPSITQLTFADAPSGLTVTLNKVVTGTAPFNTTGQSSSGFYPGDDYSDSDDYIRTLDTIAYTIDYGVNPAGTTANNVVIKANLEGSSSVKWNDNLSTLYAGLTISADGKSITYNLGNVSGGNAFSFSPTANIDGAATNGDKFKLVVIMESDNVAATRTESREITISASPKFDLGIKTYSKKNVENALGVLGTVVYSTIEVLIDDGKGSEYVDEALEFAVDLSDFRAKGMNAEIYNSGVVDEKAVAKHGDFGYIHWYGKIPWGNSAGNNSSSVINTAKFQAVQGAIGQDISITITDADLTGNHIPTLSADGGTISLDENYVVAGTLAIWVPASDIPLVDTNVKIAYKSFDPNSISGQSNYKLNIEPLVNNESNITLKRPTSADGASKSYFYGDVWYSYENGDNIYGEIAKAENSGMLIIGEEFDTRIKYGISGSGDHTNVAVVTKFDSSVLELIKDASGIAHKIERVSGIDINDVIVEYGVGSYVDWNEMRSFEGEDSDSLGGWYQNINDAPSEITKIRIRTITGVMPSDSNIYVILKTKIKDNALVNTKVPVFLSYKTSKKDAGKWIHSYYDLDTGLPSSEYRSDNALVTGVKSRVEVTLSTASEKVGNQLNVDIDSSLTAKGKTGFADNVELKLLLAKGLSYIDGSAKKAGISTSDPSIVKNADGTSSLTWSLGRKEINVALEQISFDTKIDLDQKNLTELPIKVTISTPLDASNEVLRSAQKSVVATNDSSWGIFKSVEKEVVEVGESLKYTLKYFQFTDRVLNDFEFIDILPYIGDGRTPNSNFNGTYSIESVQVNNGETFLVTDSNPSTINIDPSIVGTTSWVAYGSIPSDTVTAIKIHSSSFPNNQSTRSIDIVLKPSANLKDNIYTNNFTGRTSGIIALVESNDVSIRVVSSKFEGIVWEDENADTVVDAAEVKLSGVSVKLLDQLDKELSSTTTDVDGKYSFENLKSGVYKVKVDGVNAIYTQTFEYDGTLDQESELTLNINHNLINVNFGYENKSLTPTGRVIVIHKNGTTILNQEDLGVNNVGVAYTTSPLAGAEYDKYVVASPANKDGNYIDGTIEVIYLYVLKAPKPPVNTDGNLIVRHLDKETNQVVATEVSTTDKIGNPYTTIKKDISNYTFTNVDALENGVYIDGTSVVTYYYTKNRGTVITKYLEVNTNRVLSSEITTSNYVGENYTTLVKDISNYNRYNVPTNATGTYVDGTIVVIYYYNVKNSSGGSSNSNNNSTKKPKKEKVKTEVVIEEPLVEEPIIEEVVEVIDVVEEVIVEIIDEEIPEGTIDIEEELFDIEDEEIPLGDIKITRKKLPQTGKKIPYANYILGLLIINIGLAIGIRKTKKKK